MCFSKLNTQHWLPQSLFQIIISCFLALITIGALAQTPQTPTANFTAILNPFDPQMVLLDATASYDPNGSIKNYQWITSKNHSANDAETHFKFDNPGIYTIVMMVSDNEGLTDTSWYTLNVGNKNQNCHPRALYLVDTQELIIPFIAQYDPFNHIPLQENTTAAYTVTLQADANFNFRIKPDSLAFVDMVEPNPCHALYAEIERTLHIPFINVLNLPDSALVYQATLQQREDDTLIIKTLTQWE